MSRKREDYYFDPERRLFEADGKTPVPYEKQVPIICRCGYVGKVGDLGVPDDDNDPLVCPQCLTAAWEYGISEHEAKEFLS